MTTHGLDTINAVRSRAEAAGRTTGQVFGWAVGTCLKLAGIVHALNRDGGETIGVRTWDDARQLTEWMMVAHGHSLGHLRLKLGRKKRGPAPARPDDLDRLVKRMAARQSTSYRQLVQALPRRAKGYWRTMHEKALLGELRRP